MISKTIDPPDSIAGYVKKIIILKSLNDQDKKVLPFYADGYPGIMHQQTQHGVYLMPKNKRLSELFLYGLTILPIELSIEGEFELIVFQLYPFASKVLLNIDPKELNDECFDLMSATQNSDKENPLRFLSSLDVSDRVLAITAFIEQMIQQANETVDNRIPLAVSHILESRGTVNIKTLRGRLHITERTFERQFARHVGVSPKQFARIIQFEHSLQQLVKDDFDQLSDVAFENGFSDQSHFIRTFKQFTGKTPAEFQRGFSDT